MTVRDFDNRLQPGETHTGGRPMTDEPLSEAGEVRLTKKQRALARHALGLNGNGRKQSYRNRFVCGDGHPDHPEWMRMYRKNAANMRRGVALFGGDDLFWLTKQAARSALEPGESLDPEDFG